MILIGYSGHAFVAYGILRESGYSISGYCDIEEKPVNPFHIPYLGYEGSEQGRELIRRHDFFIGIGDNRIRRKIFDQFAGIQRLPINAIHPSAVIDKSARIAAHAVMIAAGAKINPLATVGTGAICNTGSIIEHECQVGDFAHIGPGAVLCGNVIVGEGSFVGAGAVVRQNLHIGRNAMIGAGAVVVKPVGDGETVMGNPARLWKPR